MGIAKIYNQKQSGIDINGIIQEYYAAAGETIKRGDFVKFVEGVASAGEIRTDDIIPKTWTEVVAGTKYVANDGTILESEEYYDVFVASNACDGNLTTRFHTNVDSRLRLSLKFPQITKINKMYLRVGTTVNPTFEASNDGETWEALTYSRDSTGSDIEYYVTFLESNLYKYYRVTLPAKNGTRLSIYEWQVLEWQEVIIETQVQKVIAGQFNGISQDDIVGGDDTGHGGKGKIVVPTFELSNLPIGTLVRDANSTFLGEPVVWKIADKNHEGYPSDSVTLITDKIIGMRGFDAKEPNNNDTSRKSYGNNRYSISNIRQWLNSDAEAGQWYSAQHSYDTPPNSTYVWQYGGTTPINPYEDKTGFLNAFSDKFRNSMLNTTITVALSTIDGGGSENLVDKIFLASNTEVGLANENGISEGRLLPIFGDNTSRISDSTESAVNDSNYVIPANSSEKWVWQLRTPCVADSYKVRVVDNAGNVSFVEAMTGHVGIRPLCNLPSSIKVTQDEDGIYKLNF